ncbi:TPA: DNA breaking-rejoining protein [Salmonella enterica subsp. enterica serovar Concord]|nr:DNA breaking-rejoining protein [Salmonella enterica subsp. enterica serovar Concord]
METKEENVKRLQELAVMLGRDADLSGSAADIRQRVAEWEEEAGTGDEAGENNGDHDAGVEVTVADATHLSTMVTVTANHTLHVHALEAGSERKIELLQAGSSARISAAFLDEMLGSGLVEKL